MKRLQGFQCKSILYLLFVGLALMGVSCGNVEEPAEEVQTETPAEEENVMDSEEGEEAEEETKEPTEAKEGPEQVEEESTQPVDETSQPRGERPKPPIRERPSTSESSSLEIDRARPDEVRQIEREERDEKPQIELRPASSQGSGQGEQTTRSREIETVAEVQDEAQEILEANAIESQPAEQPNDAPSKLENYSVLLELDSVIKHPGNGVLTVWIGMDDLPKRRAEGVTRDETTIPASIGQYATVKPIAPNFDIDPPIKQCIRIHPSGSEVQFVLTPKDSGTFRVSAQILLYDSINCNGPPVPKSASTLSVKVHVEKENIFKTKLAQLGEILWENFLKFWGALLAVLFGFLIYKIRKKLKIKPSDQGRE